eukprot:15189891-Ditylum_brightwellii.AAC.1
MATITWDYISPLSPPSLIQALPVWIGENKKNTFELNGQHKIGVLHMKDGHWNFSPPDQSDTVNIPNL